MNHQHVWQPSSSGSPKTLLMLHGTGGDEHSLLPLASVLDSEASVLSVRGNVLEGSAPRLFRRLAEGVFDVADLIQRTNDLADFLLDAEARYNFDRTRMVAVGYSNGANIAAALLLLRPESLCGGMLVRSMPPLEPETAPNLVGKHVLMLSGDSDPILPVQEAQRLQSMFRTYGAEITFELLRAGHELTRRDVELGQQWLASLSAA